MLVILPSDALIVVDVQRDFCPGGPLEVPNGDEVVPIINTLIPKFENVIFTRDWHPVDHCSFSDNPEFKDMSWPPHCVQETEGAMYHPDLTIPPTSPVMSKGTNFEKEAYSGFDGTDLLHVLRERSVQHIYVAGLATDYCVKFTALDAAKSGFHVFLIDDACRGIADVDGAKAELQKHGVTITHAKEVR